MKTQSFFSLLFIVVLISCCTAVHAQEWTLLNPQPTYNNVWEVDFPSPDTGYIVGDNSLLMRTINGGETWEELNFPKPETQLRNVSFVNNNKGFIANNNVIYTTHDAGETWESVTVDIPTGFWETYFYNEMIGFAFGYYSAIAKTVDGGESWEKLSFSTAQDNVFDAIGFANPQTGYVVGRSSFVGDGAVCRRTDDGGETWTDIEVDDRIDDIKGLAVLGPDELWIGAGNSIYNSDSKSADAMVFESLDGGETWKSHVIGTSNSSLGIEDIEFINQNEARVLNMNHFYTTSDGGENWTDTYTYGTEDQFWLFNAFTCLDVQTAILVGQGPTMVKTTDMGQSFTSLVEGSTNSFDDIYFIDSLKGCVGSFGPIPPTSQMFYTEDGGNNWQESVMDTMAHQTRIFDMDFSTPEIGWASGRGSTPYKTIDGGKTWTYIPTGFDFWLMEISTPDVEHIFMAGWNAEVIKSEDGGTTWMDVSPDVQNQLLEGGFVFTDNEVGYIALSDQNYNHGKLLKTTNGGMSWDEIDYGYDVLLECMGFADAEIGLIGLSNEKTLVTNDGGASWVESEIDAPSSIKYLKMFSANTAVAAVEFDFVAVSYDGGLTFETMYSGPYTWPTLVHDYHFIDENKGWVSGKNGMIMRYDARTTGIDTEEEMTEESNTNDIFYPNPAANFIYLKDPDFISLIIFDMDGKVVHTHQNGHGNKIDISALQPGLYMVSVYTKTTVQHQKFIKQ